MIYIPSGVNCDLSVVSCVDTGGVGDGFYSEFLTHCRQLEMKGNVRAKALMHRLLNLF